MYTKDLKHKMTLRLNDELFAYVNEMSDKFSISPSDFIRQCIAQTLDARKIAEKTVQQLGMKSIEELKEGLENGIDRKTDKHDFI